MFHSALCFPAQTSTVDIGFSKFALFFSRTVYRLQRIVRLGGAVDDDMANLLVAQLLYLDSVDPKKDITMYVNSPGGSVTAGTHRGGVPARSH